MNIAINGFGRIGRSIYRIITSRTNHKVLAINDLRGKNKEKFSYSELANLITKVSKSFKRTNLFLKGKKYLATRC